MTEQQEPNKMILNAEEFHTFVPPMYSSALPEQQQEPEYIITEEQVRDIMRFNEHGLKTLQHDIRSHPLLEHDAEIREEVIKELLARIEEKPICKDGEAERCRLYAAIEDMGKP